MRFQFTLQTLLLSAVVIWSSMAAFGPWGLVLAAIILAAVALFRSAESMWRAAAIVGLIILCGLCLSPLLQTEYGRRMARRVACTNNLKQIAIALQGYHDAHGCFPPAYISDEGGRPMHSWRVLILPYIGQRALYEQYAFSEPWDGPNNRKLAGQIPSVYQCPSSNAAAGGRPATSYLAVVGPKNVWPRGKTTKLSDIRDGAAYTIMLVEVANSDIHWMEPRDLSFEDALRGINSPEGMGISSRHISGEDYFHYGTPIANVAFADTHVRRLPEGFPVEELKSLLTIDAGDAVETHYSAPLRLKWGHCIAVVALVVSTLLLLLRPRRREPPGTAVPGR